MDKKHGGGLCTVECPTKDILYTVYSYVAHVKRELDNVKSQIGVHLVLPVLRKRRWPDPNRFDPYSTIDLYRKGY